MKNYNECFRSLNMGLPDDVERLKAAGYYEEAIARIDAYLAEDWTQTQNGPYSNGLTARPENEPQNPTPQGVEALRDALLAQREIMRRIPAQYTWTKEAALAELQRLLKDFTPEEFDALDQAGRMDWRFVEGEKRYLDRFASTLIATHADLAARQKELPPEDDEGETAQQRRHRLHEKMEREGQASAHITIRAGIGMSDAAFEKAPCRCLGSWAQQRPCPGLAAPPGGLPGPERHRAAGIYRAACGDRPHRCGPAHGLLGSRPDGEPPLWRNLPLPPHRRVCRPHRPAGPAPHAGGSRRLCGRPQGGSAPHHLYALPAGSDRPADGRHHRPGGEGPGASTITSPSTCATTTSPPISCRKRWPTTAPATAGATAASWR